MENQKLKVEIKKEIKEESSKLENGARQELSKLENKTNDNLKRKIKTEEKEEPPFKIVRTSDVIGQNPSFMLQMLYNNTTKEPFMYSMPLKNNGIHIYQIFKWASQINIDFVFKHNEQEIILYGYQFIEDNITHDLVICNDIIGKKALKECEHKNLIPYENKQVIKNEIISKTRLEIKNETVNKVEIKNETVKRETSLNYDNVIKKIAYGKLFVKKNNKQMDCIITTNVITHKYISDIILKMKELKQTIQILDYYVDNFTECNYFEIMLNKVFFDIFNE